MQPIETPQSKSPVVADQMDSKARIAQLTAQIQARLASRPNLDSHSFQRYFRYFLLIYYKSIEFY